MFLVEKFIHACGLSFSGPLPSLPPSFPRIPNLSLLHFLFVDGLIFVSLFYNPLNSISAGHVLMAVELFSRGMGELQRAKAPPRKMSLFSVSLHSR